MNWYRITVTYDDVPDEPNLFIRNEEWVQGYFVGLRVVLDEGQQLSDGGTRRLEPEPHGCVLRWELTEEPVPDTKYRER